MKRKLVAFSLFAAWCTLVGIGSAMGPAAKIADLVLVFAHLGGVAVLSVSALNDRMRGPRRSRESLFRRYRRWFTDDSAQT